MSGFVQITIVNSSEKIEKDKNTFNIAIMQSLLKLYIVWQLTWDLYMLFTILLLKIWNPKLEKCNSGNC